MDSFHHLESKGEYEEFFDQGTSYLRAARNGAAKRPDVFLPEIIYNLTAMAIEKFLMALIMYHGDLAENHTMHDLQRSAKKYVEIRPELAEKLDYIDSFQDICSLSDYRRRIPTPKDVEEILAIGRQIKCFVALKIFNQEGPCRIHSAACFHHVQPCRTQGTVDFFQAQAHKNAW